MHYGEEIVRHITRIILLLLFCTLWPAATGLSDYKPIVTYTLPADIMRVELATETWTYRLFEDGTVKKIVSERVYVASEEEPAGDDIS